MNVLKKYKYILICIVVVMLIGGLSLKGKEETNEFVIFNTDTEEKDLQERFIYIDIKSTMKLLSIIILTVFFFNYNDLCATSTQKHWCSSYLDYLEDKNILSVKKELSLAHRSISFL